MIEDLITEVSLLSSHVAIPREGHMEAAVHVMAHVSQRYDSRLMYHPTYPEIDHCVFMECDKLKFYRDAKEAIPVNVPEPWVFVDSNHAEDRVSCRSRTGFLIYMNTALVQWFSKKQTTVETSVFGTEFVAMKQGIDALRGLRYRLRMYVIPTSGPLYIYGDMQIRISLEKGEQLCLLSCSL